MIHVSKLQEIVGGTRIQCGKSQMKGSVICIINNPFMIHKCNKTICF